jgi:tripartite-type tricarboxylate transporter receptor subunit TctC
METMEDPELIAEIKKRHLDLEPLSGEEVQKIVEASVATPKELVEQAKRYIAQ